MNTAEQHVTLNDALAQVQEYHTQGHYDHALHIATQLEQYYPKKSIIKYMISSCLHHLERYEEAIPYVEYFFERWRA